VRFEVNSSVDEVSHLLGYNTVWVLEQFTASIFKVIYLSSLHK